MPPLRRTPVIVYEAEGAAAPPAAPVAPDGGGAAAPAPASAAANVQETPAATPDFFLAADTRPDWLPETFYDAERKGVPIERLATSYRELQGRFSQKNDALKAELMAELRKDAPASADAYKFEFPQDFKLPDGFELSPPKGDDPLLSEAQKVFHELGASPAQWQRVLGAFVQSQVIAAPDIAAEKAKLGEGAEERVKTVDMFFAAGLPEQHYRAIAAQATNADFMLAMEAIMQKMQGAGGGGGLPTGLPGGGNQGLTGEDAIGLMRHADYNHPQKGEGLRKQVYDFLAAGGRIPRGGTGSPTI